MAIKSYLKNGKKLFVVEVKGRDREGKQIYRSRQGITSERKAEDIEFELKKEIESIANQKPILSWNKWFLIFMEAMKLRFKPSTLYTYDKCLKKYVSPIWDEKELGTILKSDVHRLIYEQLPEDSTQHTRKAILKLVRRVFEHAVCEGIINHNPCSGLSVKATPIEQKVLNRNEVETLLKEARTAKHPFYDVWVFALKSGMRSGEMICLLWSDIDFHGKVIHVSKSWNSKNGLKTTKSGRSRVIPISDDFLQFLKELKLKADPNSEHVLPRLTEWYRGDQAKVLRGFCESVGITKVRFHDLRATFITNLLAQGVSLARVMAIVGHNQIDTTNHYLRKAGVELKGATNELGYAIPQNNAGELVSLNSYREA